MRNTLRALFAFLGYPNLFSKDYTCSKCGYIWPKATAKTSSDPSYPHGIHVHCPRCGKVIEQHIPEKSE